MRLVNVERFLAEEEGILSEFNDADTPAYAILSHTWDKEEFLFEDVRQIELLRSALREEPSPSAAVPSVISDSRRNVVDREARVKAQLQSFENKLGYVKVRNACLRAMGSFLSYLWVDTCCIDKSSSAELQEAINSMWQWYEDSEICFAYIGDLDISPPVWRRQGDLYQMDFRPYKWVRRGWTLQELLAPKEVIFFNRDWGVLGNNFELAPPLSIATGIDVDVLRHKTSIFSVSIARRMSWAAGRQTTRPEDRAYSLLGIFQVNMPMLYGEKERAFGRLQEEILKMSTDQSILAWEGSSLLSINPASINPLLAQSPDDFKGAGDVLARVIPGVADDALETTSTGLRIWTYLLPFDEKSSKYHAVLNCSSYEGLETQICTLSIREFWDSDAHSSGMRRVFYVNSAARLVNFTNEREPVFAPERRLDWVSLEKLDGRKKELITVLRGSITEKPSPMLGTEANGVRISLPRKLKIIDAFPTAWAELQNQTEHLPSEAIIYNKVSRGAWKLWHQDGSSVVLALHVEGTNFSAGFHEDVSLSECTARWNDFNQPSLDMLQECRIGGEAYCIRLPNHQSPKPTVVIHRKDRGLHQSQKKSAAAALAALLED